MDRISGYCDLCVPYNKDLNELKSVLNELLKSGFKNVAIEQVYDDRTERKQSRDPFPDPASLENFTEFDGKLKLLHRLTIRYSEADMSFLATNSLKLQKFQIIAGQPLNETTFTNCCSTFPCDIISIPHEDCDFRVSRKNYSIAVRRGLFFEIKYGVALSDTAVRRRQIIQSHSFFVSGKSKNVIITSGITNPFFIRSPSDIANLGLIFGLSEEQSRNAILEQCRNVILRAQSRVCGKTNIFFKSTPMDAESDDDDDGSEEDDDSISDNVPAKKIKNG